MAITRHAYAPAPILMSMVTWKKLNPDQQKAVVKAAQEAAVYERAFNNASEKLWVKELEGKGMKVTTPDLKPFLAAVKPVYDAYTPKFGKDFIAAIQNTK